MLYVVLNYLQCRHVCACHIWQCKTDHYISIDSHENIILKCKLMTWAQWVNFSFNDCILFTVPWKVFYNWQQASFYYQSKCCYMWPVFEVALRVQAKSVFQNWVFRSCSLISYCTVIFSWLCILRPWHIPSSSDVFHVNVNEDKIWYLWKKVGGGLGFIKCWNVKEI